MRDVFPIMKETKVRKNGERKWESGCKVNTRKRAMRRFFPWTKYLIRFKGRMQRVVVGCDTQLEQGLGGDTREQIAREINRRKGRMTHSSEKGGIF